MNRFVEAVLLGVICAFGAALQWHEQFQLSTSGSIIGFVTSLFPYVLCIAVAACSVSVVPAIAGATFALMLDAISHYDVFVHPTGLSSLLSFLFVPLFSTLVFVPIVMLATRAIMRRRARRRDAKEEARSQRPPPKLEPRLR